MKVFAFLCSVNHGLEIRPFLIAQLKHLKMKNKMIYNINILVFQKDLHKIQSWLCEIYQKKAKAAQERFHWLTLRWLPVRHQKVPGVHF